MQFILPHGHSTILTTKFVMYSYSQTLHTLQHKLCHVFFFTATPHCSQQNNPYILITATTHSSLQNKPCILPQSLSTPLTTKYAVYSYLEALQRLFYIISFIFFLTGSPHGSQKICHVFLLTDTPNLHHKICHVFFFIAIPHFSQKICHIFLITATPHSSLLNMPYILPHRYSTLLTTQYAIYSYSKALYNNHYKICHVFFLTATTHCSNKYVIYSYSHTLHTYH